MGRHFLPRQDLALQAWAVNFVAPLVVSPAEFGFTVPEVAALQAEVDAYVAALAISLDPETRTKSAVARKNVARETMVASLRSFARRLQASPSITVGQKSDLGLPIHREGRGRMGGVPIPSTEPLLAILTFDTHSITLAISDQKNPNRRARPTDVAGADLFCFFTLPGHPRHQPPSDLSDWRYLGRATRPNHRVTFTDRDAGKIAHFAARWVNPANEPGPVSGTITAVVYGNPLATAPRQAA